MKRILQTLLTPALLASSAFAQETSATGDATNSGWTVRDHLPLAKFVIYSHRGAGELVPENTLAAFEMGWKLGTVPEADMRTTKDGVLVAFHDANFKRTVKTSDADLKKKSVSDLTFAELSKLDVGGWKADKFAGLRVPKLAEVFEAMRGMPERQLCLDFKYVDLGRLAELVRQHDVERQVVLATSDHAIIRRWKTLLPDSPAMLWMAEPEEKLRERLAALRTADFAGINRIQFHPRANTNSASAEPFTISRAFLRATADELRARGIAFEAFPRGITNPEAYCQLLDLGVTTFSTDYPELAIQAVRDYYRREP